MEAPLIASVPHPTGSQFPKLTFKKIGCVLPEAITNMNSRVI